MAESPKNVSILEGEDTTLKCKIRSQAGDVIWCKDDFCAFTRKRNFADSRFSFVGDETKGEHHLSIRNVSINDNANYQCQVTASQNEKALKSDSGFLTVLGKYLIDKCKLTYIYQKKHFELSQAKFNKYSSKSRG